MWEDLSFPSVRAGLELRKLSLEDRIAFLRGDVDSEGPVISRAEPRDKQDIVRLLKEDGEVSPIPWYRHVFRSRDENLEKRGKTNQNRLKKV